MIFITLGSQKFQFDRLLQKVDSLIENNIITEKVIAQTGYSKYEPKHFEQIPFLSRDQFAELMQQADIVITHGGTGAIIGAVKKGKKVIAVPRLAKYGEHVDNHQLEIVNQFKDSNLIIACTDLEELEIKFNQLETVKLNSYISNTQSIIDDIINYLEG